MSNSWDQRRLTITADELMRRHAPRPAATGASLPAPATPPPASWLERKLAGSQGWPWREIMTTTGICVAVALAVVLILNSGWTLPSLPRRRTVPALVTAAPPPVATERVMEVQQPPVEVPRNRGIIIVTVTPVPVKVERPAQPQPVPRAPVVNQSAPQDLPTVGRPTARPTLPTIGQAAMPTALPPVSGGPVRAAGVSAPVSASDSGPQGRLLSRPCQFPDAPQGTVLRGYYTDERGVKRDAVCRFDGWKAVD